MRLPFRRDTDGSDQTREQLRLAAAVAAESVMTEHVRYALELLDEGGDRVPVERLLLAYARLHHLSNDERHQLMERVFVALGRDPDNVRRAPLRPPRSIVRRAAGRIRGRVHLDLREWVDRHTARVELAVLDVHVEHALRFVRILFDERAPEEAVEVYADSLGLRATATEMVRLRVLAEAPVHGEEDGKQAELELHPTAEVEPLHPPRSRLRLAEEGG